MERKLSEAKCRVVPCKNTIKDYQNTVIYKGIAQKFDSRSKNKELIYFPKSSLTSTLVFSDPNTSSYLCRPNSSGKKRR